MSSSEYRFWFKRALADYTDNKKTANNLTQAEAEKIAHNDFDRYLPDGLESKDQFLFTAKDDEQNIVGFVWFGLRGSEENRKAFVYDIVVEEKFRGHGYGRKLMLFIEDEVNKMKIRHIGLHVFGYNKTAIRLYQSLGYVTTDLVMEKELLPG